MVIQSMIYTLQLFTAITGNLCIVPLDIYCMLHSINIACTFYIACIYN